AASLHLVVADLDDELRTDGGLLELAGAPAVRLAEPALGRVLEQRLHELGDLRLDPRCDRRRADVVELALPVVETEQQGRDLTRVLLPTHAGDHAVGRLVLLDLHDRLARSRLVLETEALRDHTVETRGLEAVEPGLGSGEVARGGRDPEAFERLDP